MQNNFPILKSCKPLKSEFNNLKEIKVTSEVFTLGRGLQSSTVIGSIYISRSHCILKSQNGTWFLEDLSTCGVQINGKKIGKGGKEKLSNNDIITLEPTQEFVYKFIWDDDHPPLKKRIKLENDQKDVIFNDVKIKFEQSQSYEIQHLEDKIHKQKQIQETNKLLKHQLHQSMNRKLEQLESDYAAQIENLKGEKLEVERQKTVLLAERDEQVAALKSGMDNRIKELMQQIKKHSEIESELVVENNALKEKLLKEREEFLYELNRESSSKQDLLEKLQDKMKEQEELRLKEKMELEVTLQKELEQLRLAKEKELNELAEQQKKREQELMQEHKKIKENLEKQIQITEMQKQQAQQQLNDEMEKMKKVSTEEKVKIDQLIQEREEIQQRLQAAKEDAQKSVVELKMRVEEREIELAALAAERIQKQSEQSGEVINLLQEQLEKVKNQLRSVECEKEKLLENVEEQNKPNTSKQNGSSKQNTLAEVSEIMESELQCSICAELFVTATTLNCSHTFCRYCITTWKKKKKDCPICRAPIASECRSLVLDSFIDKMVQNLTDEMKQKREKMLKTREDFEHKLEQQTKAEKRRRRSSSESNRDDSDTSSSETEEEYDTDMGTHPFAVFLELSRYLSSDTSSESDSDSSHSTGTNDTRSNSDTRRRYVAGTPGSYYGGYGHCFRCGARGHWARGCPRL